MLNRSTSSIRSTPEVKKVEVTKPEVQAQEPKEDTKPPAKVTKRLRSNSPVEKMTVDKPVEASKVAEEK